jgi:hypothetical protein
MTSAKRTEKYVPTRPPIQASPELRDWLREELDRLAQVANIGAVLRDELNTAPRMYLAGLPSPIFLDTTPKKLVNYTLFGTLGDVPIEPDPVAGTITLPVDGFYKVTIYIVGQQPENTQDETARLLIEYQGSLIELSVYEVSSNKTDLMSFASSFSRQFSAGETLALYMDATGTLETFNFDGTTLEVTLVTAIDPQQFGELNMDPIVVP